MQQAASPGARIWWGRWRVGEPPSHRHTAGRARVRGGRESDAGRVSPLVFPSRRRQLFLTTVELGQNQKETPVLFGFPEFGLRASALTKYPGSSPAERESPTVPTAQTRRDAEHRDKDHCPSRIVFSISSIFQSRRQPFKSHSRRCAISTASCGSKYTRRSTQKRFVKPSSTCARCS